MATDLTPLRLITNQARVRITLKKRMADCAILVTFVVTVQCALHNCRASDW